MQFDDLLGTLTSWWTAITKPVVYLPVIAGIVGTGVGSYFYFFRIEKQNPKGNEVDIMGIPPVSALVGDGHISAGFSDEGKLVTFFYPTVGAYDIIPYYTTMDESAPFYGAPRHLGCFAGLARIGMGQAEVNWMIDDRKSLFSHDWDFPGFDFQYSDREFSIRYKCYSLPDKNTVVIDYNITNNGDPVDDLGFAYYAMIEPKRASHNPKVFTKFDKQTIPLGGWDDLSDPLNMILPVKVSYTSGKMVWSISGDLGMSAGYSCSLPPGDIVYIGSAGCDLEKNEGCFSRSYTLNDAVADQSWELPVSPKRNAVTIWKLGRMEHNSVKSFKVFITAADNKDNVAASLAGFQEEPSYSQPSEVKKWWETNITGQLDHWINRASNLFIRGSKPLNEIESKYLKWWVITNQLLTDRNKGSIVASPVLMPKYCGVWPRDAGFQVITWIHLGYRNIADKYFEYLFNLDDFRKGNRWFQCYNSDNGSYAGLYFPSWDLIGTYDNKVLEEDQMAISLIATWTYYKEFGALPPKVTPDMIRGLAEYIVGSRSASAPKTTITPVRQLKAVFSVLMPDQAAIVSRIAGLLRESYPVSVIPGLIRPSSDVYELPGRISGDLGLVGKIGKEPNVLAVRQSAYTNFAASGALFCASDILNENKYAEVAGELREKAEDKFYSGRSGHFKSAFDNFHRDYYDNRLEDVQALYGWPFQAYAYKDEKVVSHLEYSLSLYGNKLGNIDPSMERIFYPMMLNCLAMAYLSEEDDLISRADVLFNQTTSELVLNPKNHYLPEAIGGEGTTKRLNSAWPLGWSNAAGIMYLLIKSGYRPIPLSIHNIKNEIRSAILDAPTYMKIKVRAYYEFTMTAKTLLEKHGLTGLGNRLPDEKLFMERVCKYYGFTYNDFMDYNINLAMDPFRFRNFQIRSEYFRQLMDQYILENTIINTDEEWEDIFSENKEYSEF